MEAGLDSLAAVELRNGVSSAFSITLPATLAFDFPTMAAIAQHIADNSTPTSTGDGFDPSEGTFPEEDDLFNVEPVQSSIERDSGGLLRTTTLSLQSIVADIAGQTVAEAQPMAEVRIPVCIY